MRTHGRSNGRWLGGLGLIWSILFLLPAVVLGQSVIDQEQPIINTARGVVIAIGGSSQQKLAQVVTAGVSGLLAGVRLPVSGSSGNLIVEIRGVSGNIPNGAVLTSQSVPASSIPGFFPSPPSFRSIVFSAPVPIAAGTRFAIVLWSTSSFSIYPGPIGDSYLGGNAYFDSRPNPLGVWVCECEFQNNSFDLPFQTLVQVADATPPTITCPTNIVTTTAPGQCSRVVNYPAPTATDNQLGVTVTSIPPPGSTFPKGITTVTCTARDAAGNMSTCAFTVTVVDNEAPILSIPGAVNVSTGPGSTSCGVIVPDDTLGSASVTDNCGGVTLTRTGIPAGNFFPVGKTTITYTARDLSGNVTIGTRTVTVVDDTPPTISVSSNPVELWPPNRKYTAARVSQFVTEVNDNCDGVIAMNDVVISSVSCDEADDAVGDGDGNTVNDVLFESDCNYVDLRAERDGAGNGRVYTINLEVRDSHGNVGTASFKVTVPHDKSVHSPAVEDEVQYTVLSACATGISSLNGNGTRIVTPLEALSVQEEASPRVARLYDNYPNPFNPSTRIAFELPANTHVSLKIYNTLGQVVATLIDEEKSAGRHEVTWDASNLPSGVYFYRILAKAIPSGQAGAFSDVKRLLLLK